jgi:hypothetical protein
MLLRSAFQMKNKTLTKKEEERSTSIPKEKISPALFTTQL